MTGARFRLHRNAARQLTLELGGDLDENAALYCESETRADLALVASGSLQVLWDLRGVTSYSLEARMVLARLQQFLAAKSQRTAYVATDAVTRSLALWAARMGEQTAACIAADRAAAQAWLAASTPTLPLRAGVKAEVTAGVPKLALP
jgi:hypothetical protein